MQPAFLEAGREVHWAEVGVAVVRVVDLPKEVLEWGAVLVWVWETIPLWPGVAFCLRDMIEDFTLA